jgi:enoyl-CoA hydratase/carnithine racemase
LNREASPVALQWADAAAEIALDGGPLNLVDTALLRGLNEALTTVSKQEGIRCLILHGGRGRAFCAGSDIREFE